MQWITGGSVLSYVMDLVNQRMLDMSRAVGSVVDEALTAKSRQR